MDIPEEIRKEFPEAKFKQGGNPIPWKLRLRLIKNLLMGRFNITKSMYSPINKNSLGITYPEITIVDKRSQD